MISASTLSRGNLAAGTIAWIADDGDDNEVV